MNIINVLSLIILGVLIIVSAYFINASAKNKEEISYPFFVSARDSVTNVRSGPSLDYPIIWTYNKKHVPFKVIDSNKEWYQIEDINQKKGWVYRNLTSSIKSAIIMEESKIYTGVNANSRVVAIINKNNIVTVIKCYNGYNALCKIEFDHFPSSSGKLKGWISKDHLWGNTTSK